MTGDKHFVALDGLRGTAALTVVILHSSTPFGFSPFPNANLAVDFFFMLSGFVIAFAYERRLQNGELSIRDFLFARVRRLHPLIVIGVSFGAAVYGTNHIFLVKGNSWDIVNAFLFGIFLIPYGGLPAANFSSHPLDPPSWSMFAEYVVNVMFALIARRLSFELLVFIIVGAAAIEIALIRGYGSLKIGPTFAEWPLGVMRAFFPFFFGVVLCRVWQGGKITIPNISFPFLPLVLLAIFSIPLSGIIDGISVFLVFPFVILAGTKDVQSPNLREIAAWAGRMSYPIYIVHYPLVWIFAGIGRRLEITGPSLVALIALEILSMGLLAWIVLKVVDDRISRYLRARRA